MHGAEKLEPLSLETMTGNIFIYRIDWLSEKHGQTCQYAWTVCIRVISASLLEYILHMYYLTNRHA